ncbi:hypothetical protein CH373_17420 [Leptospira perolatii]|uniref:Uncharacterized protein n=1 Tax=Leptospira perolatii TaxID=2023191 RepID=A0A2M9ZID7_9LEPT|nr:hypothetical protein [Leptospira perolatii]PJZ68340.1 hypothetical protein CH360_16705 [Leptospira perolatii]PJZ71828.1 hypothetical protein CH373_17420 [Leptospira perolatii]
MNMKTQRPLTSGPTIANTSLPSFLKVKKLKEVVSYYMNDKVTHALYKAVAAATSYKKVHSQNLFQAHHRVPEVGELSAIEMDFHLKRLLEDGTILQLGYFVFEDPMQPPQSKSCFVAFPEGESFDLSRIYLELLDASIKNILKFLDLHQEPDRRAIWEDLETDWKKGISGKSPFPKLFLYLKESFEGDAFRIPLDPKFAKDFLFELEDDLRKQGRLVHVPNFGLLPLKGPKEALQILEFVDEFIQQKSQKELKHLLAEEFQRIALLEKHYYSDPANSETARFRLLRAEAFSNASGFENSKSGPRGTLSAMLVRTLSEIAEKELKRRSSQREHDHFQEIKGKLSANDSTWDRKVLFVTEKEFRNFSEEVRRLLMDDSNIAYASWETSDTTMHAFMHKNADSVRQIVLSLSQTSNAEIWKILCIRKLIESHEPQIKSVFQKSDFVKAYGKVLRKGYVQYFPWYYSIFELIGIARFVQDIFFKNAKEKIRSAQNQLKFKNQEHSKKQEQARVQEKLRSEERIRMAEERSSISSTMDSYYFKKQTPPSVSDIQYLLPQFSAEVFSEILDREKFIRLAWDGGKEKSDQILCYPGDDSFRYRAKELHRLLMNKTEALQNKIRNPEEEMVLSRMKRVTKHIDSWFISHKKNDKNSETMTASAKQDEDPYEVFRKEMKKLRQNPDFQ